MSLSSFHFHLMEESGKKKDTKINLTRTVWKMVTMDQSDLLERLVALFTGHGIQFCVIDDVAVNACVEPLVSLDLDLVVAVDQLIQVEGLLNRHFVLKRFPHSLNVSSAGSDLRVQIQTDERYAPFVEGATRRKVLGMELPVAGVEDVLQGKIWAAQDAKRRGSKRQKDLADIARILEKYPELRDQIPRRFAPIWLATPPTIDRPDRVLGSIVRWSAGG